MLRDSRATTRRDFGRFRLRQSQVADRDVKRYSRWWLEKALFSITQLCTSPSTGLRCDPDDAGTGGSVSQEAGGARRVWGEEQALDTHYGLQYYYCDP
jgi:hypothetical protein